MATTTGDTPLRVFPKTKDRVRIAAAAFGKTQAEFVELAVVSYLNEHADALDEMRMRLTSEEVESVAVAVNGSTH